MDKVIAVHVYSSLPTMPRQIRAAIHCKLTSLPLEYRRIIKCVYHKTDDVTDHLQHPASLIEIFSSSVGSDDPRPMMALIKLLDGARVGAQTIGLEISLLIGTPVVGM